MSEYRRGKTEGMFYVEAIWDFSIKIGKGKT